MKGELSQCSSSPLCMTLQVLTHTTGSCSLEYRLVQLPHSLRDNTLHWPSFGVPNFFNSTFQTYLLPPHETHQAVLGLDISGILFMFVWFAVLAIILYNLVYSCLRRSYRPTGNTQRVPPPTYPGPDDHRRPGPGYFLGDYPGPPPPYTKDPSSTEGWSPGFWTGAALGALGGSLLNRSQSVPRMYDWERSEPRFRATARRRASFDRMEGSSNMGALRTSTGYGGSNTR